MKTLRPLLCAALLGALGCSARAPGYQGGGGTETDVPAVDSPAVGDLGVAMDAGTDRGPAVTDRGAPDLGVDTGNAPLDVCVPGEEFSAQQCSDGVDNNCDGRVDCQDVGCAWRCVADAGPDACLPTGTEGTTAECRDGRDNDCDGFVDCNDFSCSRNPAVTVCPDAGVTRDSGTCVPMGLESTNASCTDGRDNDCDGFIDCNDFNCSRNSSVTVCPDAGVVTRDAGTCVPTGTEGTNFECGDGRDNDCDGFVDCNDFNCSRSSSVTVCPDAGVLDAGPPDVGPRDSGNTRDAIRADTAGCVVSGSENTAAACTDGRDNDCDGFLDCVDQNCSCLASCGPFARSCTCRGPENTNSTCSNFVDEDCNGFTDCADFACSRNSSVTVCPVQ